MPACLELPMTGGRGIFPEVREVQAEGVQILPVPPVVLHVLPAMAAGRYRQPHPVKDGGLALGEVEQGVMSRIQLPATGERSLHREGDPMAEEHPLLFKVTGEAKAPERQ